MKLTIPRAALSAACTLLLLSLSVVNDPVSAQEQSCPDIEPVLAGTVKGTMTTVGFMVGIR